MLIVCVIAKHQVLIFYSISVFSFSGPPVNLNCAATACTVANKTIGHVLCIPVHDTTGYRMAGREDTTLVSSSSRGSCSLVGTTSPPREGGRKEEEKAAADQTPAADIPRPSGSQTSAGGGVARANAAGEGGREEGGSHQRSG